MVTMMALGSRAMADIAERQMRTWALNLNSQQRIAEERNIAPVPKLIQPYLAISREAGVDAGEFAQAVADKCGWRLLDRALIDYLAEHDHFSRLALEFVDEKTTSWFHEMFGKWLDEKLISQAEYVHRLGRVVLLSAQHEPTVIVGRGAQFMLPRDRGMAIRIIAPKEQRIQRTMDKRQTERRESERFVDDTDRARAHFVRRYFHHNVADPHLYDLVINLAQLSRQKAIDLIVDQCQDFSRSASPGAKPSNYY